MDIKNAKTEFIAFLKEIGKSKLDIEKAWFQIRDYSEEKSKKGTLGKDVNFFLNKLDFTYDSGYGGQELYGQILFKDGTVAIRHEYDGSEWWEHIIYKEDIKESD